MGNRPTRRPRRARRGSLLGWGSLLSAAVALALGLAASGCGGSSGGSEPPPAPAAPSALISSAVYTSLVVEVDYVSGHAPDAAALALLEQRLRERVAKPAGIAIQLDDAIASITSRYTVADLEALEASHRDQRDQAPQTALYLIYVDGGSEFDDSNGSVLGLAYGSSSLAIFPENVAAAANRFATASEVEGAVLVHELGHALGLVNNGTPMVTPHEDTSHRGHDHDSSCVMYYLIETTNIRTLLLNGGSPPTQFCAECVADLRAAGGL